ncbi:PAS domain-containing protein [Arcobacter sp. L]|jgi:aerotaxis receptor|uniref:PAS domain-containing protein n=1 Tax=Arcobacter sp. L TaxID=944547 RepID=UPI00022961A1|nr:PAS sensor domain-containing protein [Arcobacter sp. L]BAK72974.1 methyl-accepting chemotaxis protein [Arcobacter sp. L]
MNQEIILDDFAFLVSETDEKGNIIFANDDFCTLAEYSVDELIGKPHNVVRHKDMPKAAFKDLWATIQKGNVWTGYVKNSTKSGNYYWVYATIFPTITSEGTKGFISCRRKATQEEINEASELYEKLNKNEK